MRREFPNLPFLTAISLLTNLVPTDTEFLQLHALFWIEIMNLLNSRRDCHLMLQMAHQWVIKSKASVV